MNTQYSTPHAREQRGFSLVELMIAMTLGLILLTALAYFFLGSRQLNRTHDDVSRMQESGRNALEIMGRAIRQTGYRPSSAVENGTSFSTLFTVNALTGTNNTGTPDSITIRYAAQEGDNGEADCSGTKVDADQLVIYVFAVNSEGQLTCNNGSETNSVVDNIQDMQITYGIDSDKDGDIDGGYISAPSAAQFLFVAAVRIVLTVQGPTNNAATDGGALQQTYNATFTVRNQAG